MTIPAGQISVPFDVPINDDNVFEENEEFLLTIDQSSSLNGVIIGSRNITAVNIQDDDGELVSDCHQLNGTTFISSIMQLNHLISKVSLLPQEYQAVAISIWCKA